MAVEVLKKARPVKLHAALRPALLAGALLALSVCASALEINSANEAELDSVRGLGPAATALILEAREKGPFKDWADVMARVKGIKTATATKLSDAGLTVNQQSFMPAVPAAQTKTP